MMKLHYVRYYVISILFLFYATLAPAQTNLITSAKDTVTTAQIKSALLTHPVTKGTQIHVETHDGYVYLSGTVDSHAELRAAREIARNVNGVKRVSSENLMLKHSKQPNIDQQISAEIKRDLARKGLLNNPRYPSLQINVESYNGDVYLSGNIVFPYQAERAVAIARRGEGVQHVFYNFHLKG